MSSYGRHERLPQNDPDDAPQSRFHTIHDRPAASSSSSSSNSSSGAQAGYQGGGFGGAGGTLGNCCTNCCNFLPLFCRVLALVIFGGFIAFFFQNVSYNVALWVKVITDNFLNIYRVLVCSYFGAPIGALFAILHFWQTFAMMEHRKGTIYFMQVWFLVSFCVNVLFFLVFLLLSAMSEGAAYFPSYGPWPTLLGLMPLQIKQDGREEYRVCFCNIPAKYYPWIMLLLLSAFSLVSSYQTVPCLVVGLLFGYVVVRFEDYLTLSMSTLRRLESGAFSFLKQHSAFVSTDAGASGNVPEPFSLQRMLMPGTMAQAPPQAQGGRGPTGRIYGSGAAGGGSSSSSSSSGAGGSSEYYGMPPDEIEPDTVMEEKEGQPSVFASGGGHRLGGGPVPAASASSQPSRGLTSFFSRAQPAAPPPAAASAEPGAARRIPTKGLNRLVENAYKQKGAGGIPEGESTQYSSSSSSSSSLPLPSSTELSEIAVNMNMGTVDKSPLLAGMTASDADIPSAPAGVGGGEDERDSNVNRLVALGYSRDDARNALVITDDDFEAAKQFLTTPLTSAI